VLTDKQIAALLSGQNIYGVTPTIDNQGDAIMIIQFRQEMLAGSESITGLAFKFPDQARPTGFMDISGFHAHLSLSISQKIRTRIGKTEIPFIPDYVKIQTMIEKGKCY